MSSLKLDYHHEGGARDPDAEMAMAEKLVCFRIYEVLEECFPGHPWLVACDSLGGIATIHLPIFMRNTRSVIHLSAIQSPDAMKRLVRHFAGEILERYRIPRGTIDSDAYMIAREKYARHGANDIVPV